MNGDAAMPQMRDNIESYFDYRWNMHKGGDSFVDNDLVKRLP